MDRHPDIQTDGQTKGQSGPTRRTATHEPSPPLSGHARRRDRPDQNKRTNGHRKRQTDDTQRCSSHGPDMPTPANQAPPLNGPATLARPNTKGQTVAEEQDAQMDDTKWCRPDMQTHDPSLATRWPRQLCVAKRQKGNKPKSKQGAGT